MKLQKLTIHNIASIEDAVIDFAAQPLAGSEVFLITGKTGAGKSTILDAICLALYADTPRLDGTKMQGDTQDGEKTVRIDDPRQLMRRNTGEAFVTLTFTGSNGIFYEATWSVARARNKATGNIKAKEWQLKNLDTGFCLMKEKEIREEMATAIGLDFKQFCRTTLLAQGEFTRFLNSKDDEKAEILEKITGVDIYTKIGAKVYDVTNQKKHLWEDAQRQVEGTRTLTDEEISEKKGELAALDVQFKSLKEAGDEDKALLHWINTDTEFAKNVATATENYRQAITVVEGDDFKTKELLVRQWNDTIDARNWLSAKRTAEKTIAEGRSKIEECNATIGKENKTLAEKLQPALQKVQKDAKEAQYAFEKEQTEVNRLEEALATLQLNELRRLRDTAKELVRNIATTFERIESLDAEKERRAQAAKALEATKAETERKMEESDAMVSLVHDAKVKLNACKEMLDRQSDTINKFAKTLRQKLHVGDVCPVCRQTIKSELPHEEELDRLVRGLRDTFTEADAAYKELVEKKNRLDAEIRTATMSYQKAKETFDNDKSVETAGQRVVAACLACGIELSHCSPHFFAEPIGKLQEALKSLNEKTCATLKEMELKISEGEEKEKDVRVKRTALDKQRRNLELQRAAVQKTQQHINDCNGRIAVAQELKTFTENVQVKQAEESLNANNLRLEAFLNTHTDISTEWLNVLNGYDYQSIATVSSLLDSHRNSVLTKKTLMDAAVSKLDEHRRKRPLQMEHGHPRPQQATEEVCIGTLESRIKDNDRLLNEISEKKGAVNQELKADEENKRKLGALIADAESKKDNYLKWSRMNQLIGDASGSKFRKIAQSYVLTSLIHSANGYMKTLTDRYTLKVTPGTFVIMLEDAYQGYVSRAASTISGGESFLVSLSLALALSDIGRQLAVDTLFVDEGFGTLSGEPLQNAVETLRSLHSKSGRHVGIISHVEELQDRIPVQIRVTQDGRNSSSKVTIVPPVVL